MPSVKTKFIEKKDGETIRCPKNEKGLRSLPECGVFDNNFRPFQPINPPPIPPPPPHHNPFKPFRMTGLPDVFKRDIIPNTPASRDVRFPDPELLPDNVDDQDDYYNFRRLKNDEEIGYSRGRTIVADMLRDKIYERTTDPQAMRRTIQRTLNSYGQDPFTYRSGLDDVDVLVDDPYFPSDSRTYLDDSRRERAAPTDGTELRDIRQRDEMLVDPARFTEPTQAVVDRERRIMASGEVRGNIDQLLAEQNVIEPDRIPQMRTPPTRKSIVKDTPSTLKSIPEFHDLAFDSTNEFAIEPQRNPSRNRLTRLQRVARGIASVRTIEFDPTPEMLDEGTAIPVNVVNPFESEEAKEESILKLAGKKTRRGRLTISKRDLEEIYERLKTRGVSRQEIIDVLKNNGLYDEPYEMEIEMLPSGERALVRRMRAMNIIDQENRASSATAIDESGFSEITPRRLQSQGYRTLATEDENVSLTEMEEGQFMGRTNQNSITLDTDEEMYKVRVSGRSLGDTIRMNTIRARTSVQEAGKRFAEATNRVKQLSLDLTQGADRHLTSIRRNTALSLRSGYSNIIAQTSQLTPDELEDLRRQLSVLPPDEDLSTRGVGIAQDMVLTDDPQVDIETGLARPELETGLDFNIFDDVDAVTTTGRPSLSFRQRLRVAGQSFKDIPNQPVGETTLAGGAGMLGAFGLSAALSKAGVNPYANAAASGAFGDTTGRISAMVGNQIYQRLSESGVQAAGEAFTETAGQVAFRAGTSLLRGGLEGAGIGLAAMPLDILMNNALVAGGMHHKDANALSGATIGTAVTGTIGAISFATAPETLGLSLVVGGLATGISSLVGYFTGKSEDDKIEKQRNDQNRKIGTRQVLIESLPDYDYNFDAALSAMQKNNPGGYKNLDTGSADFATFRTAMESTFTRFPQPVPAPDVTPAHGDAKRVNDLFSQAVMYNLIDKVCADSGGDCSNLREKQPPPLTSGEVNFLNKQTNETWNTSVNLLVEQSYQEMNYTGTRVQTAQQYLLDQWNLNKIPANSLSEYYSNTAFLDPQFQTEYMDNIRNDAQNLVVEAYYNNQTKLSEMSPGVIYAANLDPDFAGHMNTFYSAMETGASNLQVTVPQLITLQSTPEEQQSRLYENMQFDRIKENTEVVDDARQLSEEQDRVRRAGYYDIDSGFLDTADPTSISHWTPSDSQILQANSAGMSLNEYVAYIHQLGLGEAGDFKKLPTYTPSVELSMKQTDFTHFEDELQMAGYTPNLYIQDADGNIVINPNASNIPNLESGNEYVSQFEPAYVTQSRHEYSNMVQNLNQKNQADIDDYNANIRRQLSVFGQDYDEMVEGQNNYIARNALTATSLMVFNQADYLNQYIIDYNPISEKFPRGDTTNQQPVTAGGQNYIPVTNPKIEAETEAAQRLGLTREQYLDSKSIVQSDIGDTIGADSEEIEGVINRIKHAPENHGVDPTDVLNVSKIQNEQQTQPPPK